MGDITFWEQRSLHFRSFTRSLAVSEMKTIVPAATTSYRRPSFFSLSPVHWANTASPFREASPGRRQSAGGRRSEEPASDREPSNPRGILPRALRAVRARRFAGAWAVRTRGIPTIDVLRHRLRPSRALPTAGGWLQYESPYDACSSSPGRTSLVATTASWECPIPTARTHSSPARGRGGH